MKKFYFSSLFYFTFYLLIAQSSPFSVHHVSNKANHPDSFSLPFTEDWSSGSFETNNWTTGCENWVIDFLEGNDEPSAEFTGNPWFQDEYSCSLVSDILNGNLLEVGKIMLDFDIELDTRNATREEKILVEIFDGTEWNTVAEFVNDGDFDWLNNSIDITRYALGHTFQVRFNATGQNSFRILYWFIDNISIYRICEAPDNLFANMVWLPPVDSNKSVAEVSWTPPESTIIDEPAWLHWGDGENEDGIGLTDGGVFSVAAQWDSLHLIEYFGYSIETIRFFLYEDGFSDIVAKIWTGVEAENLIYADTIDIPLSNSWNIHDLDTVILINPSENYRIGYTIVGQLAGHFPAGIDSGPAIPGYGDLIYMELGG